MFGRKTQRKAPVRTRLFEHARTLTPGEDRMRQHGIAGWWDQPGPVIEPLNASDYLDTARPFDG